MGANLNALIRLICCPNLPFATIDALNCVIVVLFFFVFCDLICLVKSVCFWNMCDIPNDVAMDGNTAETPAMDTLEAEKVDALK